MQAFVFSAWGRVAFFFDEKSNQKNQEINTQDLFWLLFKLFLRNNLLPEGPSRLLWSYLFMWVWFYCSLDYIDLIFSTMFLW